MPPGSGRDGKHSRAPSGGLRLEVAEEQVHQLGKQGVSSRGQPQTCPVPEPNPRGSPNLHQKSDHVDGIEGPEIELSSDAGVMEKGIDWDIEVV